jgi:hypothetical protein
MKRSIISGLALAGSAALVAMGAAPVSAATYDPLTVAYVEVNDNDLSLVGDYALEDGTPAFDVAIIFAANINTDDDGEAYLHLNERVQETLDDAENQIRPLQERGIKVTLSLLGNHDTSGFANFPTREAAEAFADQVDEVVTEYGLDGVDIDDEWVNYGSGDTAPANADSAAWLVDALDEKLPAGSIISLYDIGATAQTLTQAPTETLDRLDYIWNPYYGTYRPPAFPGVDRERLGAAAHRSDQYLERYGGPPRGRHRRRRLRGVRHLQPHAGRPQRVHLGVHPRAQRPGGGVREPGSPGLRPRRSSRVD